MRKLSISLIILVTLSIFLILPQVTNAKLPAQPISTKNLNDPYIFINYAYIPKTCNVTTNDQSSNFGWGGWKLNSGLTDYQINFQTLPTTISRNNAFNALEASFSTLQGAGGGILFHYAGESSESQPSNDGRNTLMWRNLPANVVAMTYVWLDGDRRLSGADTVFNRRYPWSYTVYNGHNDCLGAKSSFDLRDIATHEFGHWMGLGDLYDLASRDLTMYGYANRGELKKDTLGLGDTIGVRAVWP